MPIGNILLTTLDLTMCEYKEADVGLANLWSIKWSISHHAPLQVFSLAGAAAVA